MRGLGERLGRGAGEKIKGHENKQRGKGIQFINKKRQIIMNSGMREGDEEGE